MVSVYQVSQQIYNTIDDRAEITQNGRVIIDRMIREIRQAQKLITELPADTSNPDLLPHEIIFQDGHNLSTIKYIRYYLDGSNIKRQVIVYYFPSAPELYVYWDATDYDPPHIPPVSTTTEDKIVGEYVDDIEFWGNKLINLNIYLSKNNESEIVNTSVYGRNF